MSKRNMKSMRVHEGSLMGITRKDFETIVACSK